MHGPCLENCWQLSLCFLIFEMEIIIPISKRWRFHDFMDVSHWALHLTCSKHSLAVFWREVRQLKKKFFEREKKPSTILQQNTELTVMIFVCFLTLFFYAIYIHFPIYIDINCCVSAFANKNSREHQSPGSNRYFYMEAVLPTDWTIDYPRFKPQLCHVISRVTWGKVFKLFSALVCLSVKWG